jgi:uncharacterized protein with GYD domain
MPIYISRGRFTSDAVKGMLAKPENREEAVAKLFKSVGGRLIGWYLTFGRHDWLVIGEFPDEKAATSAILAAAAGGSLSEIETTARWRPKMLTPPSNPPERRRRASAAPGARRLRRDFNLSATAGSHSRMPGLWLGGASLQVEARTVAHFVRATQSPRNICCGAGALRPNATAGNCRTVACCPSIRYVGSMVSPSGNSRASRRRRVG